jgi:multiple sugar transport system substrate-binding protein
MKRATMSLAAILLVFSALLSACGGSDSADGGGEVTIEYWHANVEEERVALIKELIAKFEKKNPGIRVKQVAISEEDLPNKITVSLGANQLPAIIEGGIDHRLLLWREGVVDTQAHREIIDEIGTEDFYAGAVDLLKDPDGKGYLGVPVYGWVQGIWYNQKRFEEKGLKPPTTWENILAAAKAFHDPRKKQYGIVIGTQKDHFTEQTFSQYALSNEAKLFDEKGNVRFNTPEMTETLDFYKELAKYTPPGAESWREAKEMYLSERAPMVMYSTYLMGDLSQNKELAKNTGFVIPERKSKASFGEITAFTITNTVSEEEKEAAKRFTRFMLEKENYIPFLHMSAGGSNPVRKSIAKDPAYLDHEVLKSFGEVAGEIPNGLENLQRFGFQDGKMYPQMGDISAQFIISEAIYNMTEHGTSAGDAAKTAQSKMEKAVK